MKSYATRSPFGDGKWNRFYNHQMAKAVETLRRVFTLASSLTTTSIPLMVILSQEFSMSWSLRSISFGADLQPSSTRFHVRTILTGMAASCPCESAPIGVPQALSWRIE
jgi:hypothetical protein